jgi:hypothetical protein
MTKYNFLNAKIIELFNKHAPKRTIRITKKYAPWLTDNIKLMMSLRDKARIKFNKSKLTNHWNQYKFLRNFTNDLTKKFLIVNFLVTITKR